MNKQLVAAMVMACCIQAIGAAEILKQEDSFTGGTHFFTASVASDLEGGSFFSRRYVRVSFHAFKPVKTASAPYFIEFDLDTPDWVFVSAGETLLLKLDGKEIIKLDGPGGTSSREVLASSSVFESVSYPLAPELFARIASAQSVEFRIIGERQNITGKWTPETSQDAALFAQKMPELLAGALNASVGKPGQEAAPRVRLGVKFTPVTPTLAKAMGQDQVTGVLIVDVAAGSPAALAGIKVGDVAVRVDGRQIAASVVGLPAQLEHVSPGQAVQMDIWRQGQQEAHRVQF